MSLLSSIAGFFGKGNNAGSDVYPQSDDTEQGQPTVKVPIDDKTFTEWKDRVNRSAELLKNRHRQEWKENTAALATEPLADRPTRDLVIVNKDLPRVKQKLAQLFYQVPEVTLKPRRDQFAQAATIFQPVVNFYLSKRIRPEVMMREVLTDVMGVSGLGVSKVGYECVTEMVDMAQAASSIPQLPEFGGGQPPAPSAQPGMPAVPPAQPTTPLDPTQVQGAAPSVPPAQAGAATVDAFGRPASPIHPAAQPTPAHPGMGPGGDQPQDPLSALSDPASLGAPSDPISALLGGGAPTPQPNLVPRCIYERYYWNRISPAKFIFPEEFHGSDFDEAPWLGFEFRMNIDEAKKKYNLPDDFDGSGPDDNLVSVYSESGERQQGANTVKGWEIWYKAAQFDPTASHPLAQRVLVIIDGLDRPARHDDSPYQKFDPTTKRLIAGMTRFPIRVLTLTYISDTAIPPSDCTISRPQVKELWRSRTQMMEQRQKSLPWRWADKSRLDEETINQIEAGEVQDVILTDGPGEQIIGEVARAQYPRENFQFDNIIEGDLAEQWSLGQNQMSQDISGDTTKAEVQTIQQNTQVRLDYERSLVLRYFISGVEEIAALLQMFADDDDYINVVGPDGQTLTQLWNKQLVAGEFLFDVKPDSALRIDAAQDRADSIHLYQMMANDPFVNRQKLAEQVIRRHGYDPSHMMQQPPPPQPDKPNISYRFSGTDFLTPALPIILKILELAGIVIPQGIAEQVMAQMTQGTLAANHQPGQPAQPGQPMPPGSTQHGGPAQQVEPLSKHQYTGGGL